jgi:HSP20 family protein
MLTTAFPDVARIRVQSWSPPVDVEETEEEFQIEADVPGVGPEDVTVDLQRNELRITGQYGGEQGEGEQQQSRRGRFNYRVTLPSDVNAEACTAKLENGVLRLQLPKASAGRQRIQVQAGSGQSGQAPGSGGESQPGEPAGGTGAADGGTGTSSTG